MDEQIENYKCSEHNPIKYVTFNNDTNKYRLRILELQKATTSSDINKIVEKSKKYQEQLIKYKFIEYDQCKLELIKYKTSQMITYIFDNEIYFDLNHVLNFLNYSDNASLQKYNTYKDKICFVSWKKNKYNGYILKEYISENTLYDIIFESNTKNAKEMKTEIKNILCELRKNKMFTIQNDKMCLNIKQNQSIITIDKKDMNDDNLKNKFLDIIKHPKHSYDSYLDKLLSDSTKINIAQCHDSHILYMYLMSMKDPENRNRMFVKIGYTSSIADRKNSLESDYNCSMFLIMIKKIQSSKDEANFHRILNNYPQLKYEFNLNKSKKSEIYIFDKLLCDAFNNFMIEDNKQGTLQIMPTSSQLCSNDVYCKLVSIVDNTIDFEQKKYLFDNFMVMQENYISIQYKLSQAYVSKLNIDLEMKRLDLENEDKKRNHELEMKRLEIEGKKLEINKQTSIKTPIRKNIK